MVTKLHFPAAEHIIGIATETGESDLRSEDIAYLDTRDWTLEMEEDARTKERELKDQGLLAERTMSAGTELEYPEVERVPRWISVPRVGRNEPCPCGRGKKFKRCHGR